MTPILLFASIIMISNANLQMRTYSFSAETGSNCILWDCGATDEIFYRLCSQNECHIFRSDPNGWGAEDTWYHYAYTTKDIGNIYKVEIVLYSSDASLGVTRVRVDGIEYDSFVMMTRENSGCSLLTIILQTNDWSAVDYNPCIYDSDTLNGVTNHPTTFEPSAHPTQSITEYPTTTIPTSIPTSPPNHPSYSPTYIPTNNPSDYPTFNPSKYPTLHPSKYPTLNPSKVPTRQPTFTPTPNPDNEAIFTTAYTSVPTETSTTLVPTGYPSSISSTVHTALSLVEKENVDSFQLVIDFATNYVEAFVAGGVVFIIILLLCVYCCCKKRKRIHPQYKNHSQCKNAIIQNALVVIIAIGNYDKGMEEHKSDLDDVYLRDLPVYKDLENLKKLFGLLNYTVIPKGYKIHWTPEEIETYLKQDVCNELFDRNLKCQYDALIVCISCHGIENKIITSDYSTIEKAWIHRIISIRYPLSREIPRIFLFDSCEGSAERKSISVAYEEQKKGSYKDSISKGIALSDIDDEEPQWTKSTKNPDYKLVQIHSANIGFQSKMTQTNGSFLIYEFCKKMEQNMLSRENKSLGLIFGQIQNELHDAGRQQTVNTFNNDTGDLIFKKNRLKKSRQANLMHKSVEITSVKNKDNGNTDIQSNGYMSVSMHNSDNTDV